MSGAFDAGSVTGRLVLDVKEWSASIEKAEKDTTALGGVVRKNKEEIEKMGRAFAAVGAAITAALGIALKKTADYGDELWKTSQRTGIAVETLSGLKLAADKSALSLPLLAGALAKMSRTFVEANDGMKEYQEVVAKLGIQTTNSAGQMKSMDVLLDEIAGKFSEMPDGVEKTALAMDVFGKSGATMIPLLNLGADGLRAEREEAERLGLIMSGPAAKAGETFNDAVTTLQKSFLGLAMAIGQSLMPPVKFMVDAFTGAVVILRKALDVFPPLGAAISKVAGVVGVLATAFGGVMMVLPKLIGLKEKLAATMKLVDGGLKAMKLSLGFAVGALAAVTIAIEATNFAFKKWNESLDAATAAIVISAEKAGAGWKFAQASIRGETDVTKAKMQELIGRWREMGKSGDEIGEQLYAVFKNKIGAAAKAAAKDTADMVATVQEVQAQLTDRIKSLTLNEYDYRIWQAARWRDDVIAKTKDSVDAGKIAAEAQKAYALEVTKIRKEQAQAAADAEVAAFEKSKRAGEEMWKRWQEEAKDAAPSVQQLMWRAQQKIVAAQKWVAQQFGVSFGTIVSQAAPATEKVKKSFSDVATKINQTIQVMQQGFSQFFGALNDLSRQRFEIETKRLEAEYEQRKKQIEDSLKSEEEKATELAALDEEFAMKKNELEYKQAEANKKASLAQALVNTALAVTSALSMKPFFPMGLIAAAAALAAGMIQVRIIRNTPLPAMAEGGLVREPTNVLAGEAGPEAILPMRELKRMLGVDRKRGGAGSKTVNVNINAIDTRGMEAFTRRAVIPEIKRALAREALVISPNAVR